MLSNKSIDRSIIYFLMDPGGIGALIGVSVIVSIVVGVCIYDKYIYKPNDERVQAKNPLLIRKKSFKVKNLFNHVQI